MSGDRKLKLVPPSVGQDEQTLSLDDSPPSQSELDAANELRALLDEGDHDFANVLRAAYQPASLEPNDNDALVDRALGISASHTDASASVAERDAAARLREAIEHPRTDDRDEPVVEVLDALVSAYRPREIEPLRNELLITRALRRSSQRTGSRRVIPVVTAAVLSVAAMAAGVALYLRPITDKPIATATATATTPATMQRSRSTSELFDAATPFPRVGGESARVDRIATARAAALRDNRFALWGVR
jgi:hypothetical protein